MANDIISTKLLLGKSRQEVIEILGTDTEEGPCGNCLGYSTFEPIEGFCLDHGVLEINFNNESKVDYVRINFW